MNNSNKKITKIWTIGAVSLVILSFFILFSGIFKGIGSGYENPEANFDFAPYGISFVIISGINIVFNIIMLIIITKNKIKKN